MFCAFIEVGKLLGVKKWVNRKGCRRMPKRGENIRKRKDGRWEARCKLENGKYKSIYGNSYKEVKKKVSSRLSAGTLAGVEKPSAPAVLFQAVCEEWLSLKKVKIKDSSYSTYYTAVYNHLVPVWGSRDIFQTDFQGEIPAFVQQKFQEGMSTGRVKEILQRLKQILKFMQKRYGVGKIDFDIQIQPSVPEEIKILTKAEQQKLTDFLFINHSIHKLGIFISLYMGLRLGEVCALLWSDIDLENGVLSISKTMQRVKDFDPESTSKTKIIIETPKSTKSRRKLPIPQFLIPILKTYQGNSDAYVLTGKAGSFIEPRHYENLFKSYLKEAGIQPGNYHALRHTFATRAIEKGIDVKTLSEILGHSSVTITLRFYVHPSMENKKLCMEKIAG